MLLAALSAQSRQRCAGHRDPLGPVSAKMNLQIASLSLLNFADELRKKVQASKHRGG